MKLILLKPLIFLLRLINLAYYHFSALLEAVGRPPNWAKDLGKYFQISAQKAIDNYLTKRPQTTNLWGKKKRNSEAKIHSFYKETDYFVYRQSYFHRHKIYLDVALKMWLTPKGSLCEYGGGIGPFTNWLIKLFPGWQFTIADLDCPTLTFAKWRFKNRKNIHFTTVTPTKFPLKEKHDLILVKHVLEHVSDPLAVVNHLLAHLKSGGWLFVDFIKDTGKENLASAQQKRTKTINFLNSNLLPIFSLKVSNPADGYGLYVKL
jgi:2-polyprenyl-3-methyl-5-hydroxy-6-metoxy-1,4-benzoquinol methylase